VTLHAKLSEQALRESEALLILIENALDIITVLGSDGTVRYASPSVERFWIRTSRSGWKKK